MKRKELCEKTGLSHKTIRLYEEKGLFSPTKEYRNGREFRKYTQEDVDTLLVVAALRRAWFTMEEIRRMQQEPDAIREIIPQYRAWLLAQKQTLDGLIAATEKLDADALENVAALSAWLSAEAEKLPLPQADIRPRFKHLDEIDVRPPQVNLQDVELQFGGQRLLWAWPHKSMSQKLLDDTVETIRADQNVPVKDREPKKDPLWLRILQIPLTVTAFASFAVASMYAWALQFRWRAWLIFAVSGGILGLISYLKWRKEQQAWIERMGWDKQDRS